jgi:hypothetical protein
VQKLPAWSRSSKERAAPETVDNPARRPVEDPVRSTQKDRKEGHQSPSFLPSLKLTQYLRASPLWDRCQDRLQMLDEKAVELATDGVTVEDLEALLAYAKSPKVKAKSPVGLWCAWLKRRNWNRELESMREKPPPTKTQMTHYPGFPLGIPSCECEACVSHRSKRP